MNHADDDTPEEFATEISQSASADVVPRIIDFARMHVSVGTR